MKTQEDYKKLKEKYSKLKANYKNVLKWRKSDGKHIMDLEADILDGTHVKSLEADILKLQEQCRKLRKKDLTSIKN